MKRRLFRHRPSFLRLLHHNEDSNALHALENWRNAETYFNFVSDADLVEFATLRLEAARKRYESCLAKEKENHYF